VSKVESIFGARRRAKFGCGFLSARDVEELLEGRLEASRVERFERHLAEGCVECLHLSAAIEEFRRVLTDGAVAAEVSAFVRTERSLKRTLREAFARALRGRATAPSNLPWERELTAEELESIAAAGPPVPPQEPEDERDPDAT